MSEFEQQVIESMASLKAKLDSVDSKLENFKADVRAELKSRQDRSNDLANLIQSETVKMAEYKRDIDISMARRPCQEHTKDFEELKKRLDYHINEAERDNGWHNRIRTLENRTSYQWAYMIGCGIIGGGIATGAIKIWGGLSKILGV